MGARQDPTGGGQASAAWRPHAGAALADGIVATLSRCGFAGALASEIVASCSGALPRSVLTALSALVADGRVAKAQDANQATGKRHRTCRYWLPQCAPDTRPSAPNGHAGRGILMSVKRRLRLDHDQPTIAPPGVTVQVCPSARDHRWTVPAGTPVEGAGFAAEWARLRANKPAKRRTTRSC